MTAESFLGKASAWRLLAQKVDFAKQPVSAMIEIADRCNENCVHCYQVQGQKGEMSTEEIFGILDDLAEMGVLFLTISGGEPTLRHDFMEIVRKARDLQFAVKVYSNGLRVSDSMAAELGNLAVQEFQTSLYSHRAEVHDWVTRVPGSFDKTVNAVRSLIQHGVKVVMKSPLMSFNVQEYEDYIEFVTGLGADYQFDAEINPREGGDREPTGLRISTEERTEIRKDPRVIPDGMRVPVSPPMEAPPCGACKGNVHIEANGELRPCTLLEVKVGDALDPRGLAKAFHEDPTAQAIRSVSWADHHGCRDCDLRAYCQRCFANARKESGDALGPYASACARACSKYRAVHGSLEIKSSTHSEGTMGPYKELAKGHLETIPDALSDRDHALRAENHWVLSNPEDAPPAVVARPGQLVQLRRPGRKKRSPELIPALASKERRGP